MAGFGLLAQGMARANDKRNAMVRQQAMDERQREQDARTQEMAAIQQAALLAGLGEKGISRDGQGDPLGNTGFRQDPSRTRQAQELAAQRQRQEMLTRRRAVLQARGVNPDEIDVENDDIYESYAKFQKPEAPQAPVRGTPEYLKALDAEEGVRAKHRPARPAPKPSENYTKANAGLLNFKKALDNYKDLLGRVGPRVNPTSPEGMALAAAHTNLSMVAKSAFELGALAGPDVQMLERSVDRPVGAGALLPNRKQALLAQLAELDRFIANKQSTLGMAYGNGGRGVVPEDDDVPYRDY